MRRILNFVIDLADGILAAVLYGREGAAPNTLPDLEHLNDAKLRTWSAGSPRRKADELANPTDDLDARIRAYRARTKKIEK
jgi:hypothetical protein